MRRKKVNTMQSKLTKQLLLLLLCMLIFYYVIFYISGVSQRINDNNYKILQVQTENMTRQLKEKFYKLAKAANDLTIAVENEIIDYQVKNNMSWSEIDGNNTAVDDIYGNSLMLLLETISRQEMTGIFIYLNANYSGTNPDKYMTSLYIRDSNPMDFHANYGDLMQFKGSNSIVANTVNTSFALDQHWSFYHDKTGYDGEINQLFIKETMRSGKEGQGEQSRLNLGYWSPVFRHTEKDRQIVTYSEPLYNMEGNVIGICGIELSTDFLISLIPNTSIPFENSAYAFSHIINEEVENKIYMDIGNTLLNGMPISNLQADKNNLTELIPDDLMKKKGFSVYQTNINKRNEKNYVIVPMNLNLHGMKSFFYDENFFALLGITTQEEILKLSKSTISISTLTILLTFFILGAGLVFFSSSISDKIKKLSEQVVTLDVNKKVELERSNIKEINNLATAFEHLSVELIKNAKRLTDIADLVGVSIGGIEENITTKEVVLTNSMYKILNIENESRRFSISEFELEYPMFKTSDELMAIFLQKEKESEILNKEVKKYFDHEFEFNDKWYRMRYVREKEIIYGTMIDITKEFKERKLLEFERDYDPLTYLLNRSSYKAKIEEQIKQEPDKYGALLFCDLDNLKFINDTFGHRAGDIYIKTTAKALQEFYEYNGVVARIAGDEFVIYIHGYDSKNAIMNIVNKVMANVRDADIEIDGRVEDKVKLSVGVAFYPTDSIFIDELIKYADFAMYEIKHSSKGGLRMFNIDSYERDSYLLEKQNFLDIFIEQKRLKFAFQPIIDVKSGEVYGYEALLRPQIREIQSPLMLINLAKSQSKLYYIEKLILETVFDWMSNNKNLVEDKKIFINSISNQMLTDEDWASLVRDNKDIMRNIVCEITEQENANEKELREKLKRFKENGAMIALDDYGAGYSNEVGLLRMRPNIIKVDMEIISNIHKDVSKQQILENTVLFARKNNARIVVEGVETAEELDAVIMLGADYIQGFFVGMPSFEIFEPSDETKILIVTAWRKYNQSEFD